MKKILLIEDNKSTLDDLKEVITSKKLIEFESVNADFEKINIESIININPDLIILDIQLNGDKDSYGLNIARMLKNNNLTKDILVIILSLLDEYQEIAKKEKLCNLFLLKPCDNDEFLWNVESLLRDEK